MVLVLGNLLLLREMRDHYTRPYEDQLSELKYKNGHLEHKLKMLSHIESERGGRKNNNAVTAITNGILSSFLFNSLSEFCLKTVVKLFSKQFLLRLKMCELIFLFEFYRD